MRDSSASSADLAPLDATGAGWRGHAQDLGADVASYGAGPIANALALALNALGAGRFGETVQQAEAALAVSRDCIVGWRLLGLGYEGEGRMPQALNAYQAAYELAPQSQAILSDLGRLAMSLGLSPVAIEFFARALTQEPQSSHLAQQLSMALRDCHQYGKAIEVLSGAIADNSKDPLLWNALAAVLLQQGDTETALTVINQALQLAPDWSEALYHRAIAKLELGDLCGAEADSGAAADAAPADRRPVIYFARAQARLAAGDFDGGWRDYEARLRPEFPTAPTFTLPGRAWDGRGSLVGARIILVGEQGIGDEIMFSSVVPDVVKAVGPLGEVAALVAPRLTSLFRRSFPGVRVHSPVTDASAGRIVIGAPAELGSADFWIPMGSLGGFWRRNLAAFAHDGGFLRPDAEAAGLWRERLSALDDRPKVGLSWKSMKTTGNRLKQYPNFNDWRAVLATPSVRFVNFQYGDCELELQSADIWRPPNLDLTQDFEGSAALGAGLDLVIGVGNASTNLAAAVGAPTWFVFPPTAWPKLGTNHHPWFANTRGFSAGRFGHWEPVLADVADALRLWSSRTPGRDLQRRES